MVQNYINGERNKNLHDFNDSMIDINKKITNYLIDNCIKEKEKNNFQEQLEDVKNYIGEKLSEINKIKKKQKLDIDFIIKYGLNKNRSLYPIIGILLDQPKPLPKLLRDDDDKNKYDKVVNKRNINPYKNFSVYGRYTNNQNDKETKNNGGILRRTGSCIFENNYKNENNNEYNYNIDKDTDPHKYNHNIYPNFSKRPFFEKINNENILDKYKYNLKKQKNKSMIIDDENDYFEKEKFKAYNNKFYVPADFRFGIKLKKDLNNKINKNKIIEFLI